MALAYFLQIIHILIVGSTDGIPAYFVFFIGFFCNQSGANCVLLNFLPWSTEKSHFGRLIGRGGRRGAQALDADLGTAEVTLHLIYSVMLWVQTKPHILLQRTELLLSGP